MVVEQVKVTTHDKVTYLYGVKLTDKWDPVDSTKVKNRQYLFRRQQ